MSQQCTHDVKWSDACLSCRARKAETQRDYLIDKLHIMMSFDATKAGSAFDLKSIARNALEKVEKL